MWNSTTSRSSSSSWSTFFAISWIMSSTSPTRLAATRTSSALSPNSPAEPRTSFATAHSWPTSGRPLFAPTESSSSALRRPYLTTFAVSFWAPSGAAARCGAADGRALFRGGDRAAGARRLDDLARTQFRLQIRRRRGRDLPAKSWACASSSKVMRQSTTRDQRGSRDLDPLGATPARRASAATAPCAAPSKSATVASANTAWPRLCRAGRRRDRGSTRRR